MSHLNESDAALLAAIRTQTREGLAQVLRRADQVVLLGTPRHGNLGDSLILAGTHAYLRELGIRIRYESDYATYSRDVLIAIPEDVPILFLGGGNLGDLYPEEDEFRRRVVTDFPQRRFVLLPQTIHFQDPANAVLAHEQYSAARDMTILVRDTPSLSIADKEFSSISSRLIPDLALGWTPRLPALARRTPTVIARADKEARAVDGLTGGDWPYPRGYHRVWDTAERAGRRARSSPRYSRRTEIMLVSPTRRTLHLANVAAAEHVAATSSHVVTNRLHAHILSCLAGIPHHVTDNSYGKVRAVFEEYSGGFSTATWCDSIEEGLADSLVKTA